jgi:prevent-host-death family protein
LLAISLTALYGVFLDDRARRIDARLKSLYVSYEMYEPDDPHSTGHVSVSEARQDFAELVNRAAYGGERVLVSRRGKPIAAIVPIADVAFIERMEDDLDLRDALAALADPANAVTYPLEQVEAELDGR